jgi:hypothetical protein
LICPECGAEGCPGPGKPREFDGWPDLSAHLSEELIVKFINHYAQMIHARDTSGKRWRTKRQLFADLAKQQLDPDEIARIEQLAEERLK